MDPGKTNMASKYETSQADVTLPRSPQSSKNT